MHHYPHHIGDYAAATAHLTFVEDAAYSRLLRLYYRDERPLPCDVAACQRLVAARSKEERAAVETILREFFSLAEDGWHQARADQEIKDYQARASIARENGKRSGGRPKTGRKPKDKPSDNPSGYSTDTQNEPSRTLTVNREPSSEAKASGAADVASLLFGQGLEWLSNHSGRSETECRSLLGKWRKSLGDETLIATIGRAQREGAIDPIGWMEGAVRAHRADATPSKPKFN